MKHPKISVVTPSFNQGQFLERTIVSVLEQEYPNLEYIIIDGGSKDNSVDIIKKYEKHLKYWASEKDQGQSHAVNKGLRRATGDIIGWINSDDIYYADAFLHAARIFEAHPEVDIVFANYNFIDEKDAVLRTRKEIPYDYDTYLWSKGCYHANCAGFFRKRCFDSFGLLREDLHFGMDYELYLRFGKNNCTFKHVKEIWGGYRLHEASKSTLGVRNMLADNNAIAKEYSAELGFGHSKAYYLEKYFKYKRIFQKFLAGCYV